MKICIFGCGYLGLTFSCAMAEIGHDVLSIDTNDYKISNIKKGQLDFYEPNLKELLFKHIENNKLIFSTKLENPSSVDLYVIAVGTSEKENNITDIENIKSVLNQIVTSITKYTVIIIKSSVLPGDCVRLKEEFKNKTSVNFDIVYNPDFLSKGTAIDNILHPQRIIIGTQSKSALDFIKEMYKPVEAQVITMNEQSAELSKFAISSYIAVKTSFINEITNLAQETGADISKIKEAIVCSDQIAKQFLETSAGYGGSRLVNDIDAIISYSSKYKIELNTVKAARITNEIQRRMFISNILRYYNYNVENKVFCIWGLSFKSNTSDSSHALSNTVIDTLQRYGANIRAYDPYLKNNNIAQFKSKEEALMGSNALIVLTDCKEFINPDYNLLSNALYDKVVFDALNIYSDDEMNSNDLRYYYIGKYNNDL